MGLVMHHGDDDQPSQRNLAELLETKRFLVNHIDSLSNELMQCHADMQTPLVDHEGFPRSDIDIPRVTTIRRDIVRARNDYAALTTAMDAFLSNHFSSTNGTSADLPMRDPPISAPVAAARFSPPFCRVQRVTPGSPAEKAGLQPSDEIVKFGRTREINGMRQEAISSTDIRVSIQRQGRPLDLTLHPGQDPLIGALFIPM